MTLMHAAASGHDEMVALLIAAGAKVNAQTSTGESALSMAAERNHGKVLLVLTSSPEIDLYIKYEGKTPEDIAASKGWSQAERILKDAARPRESVFATNVYATATTGTSNGRV